MSTSYEISVDTPGAPVASTGVSEEMRGINMDTSASSVLDGPNLAGDGSDPQIQSKLAAATVAATAEVPAVGAAAVGKSVPLGPKIIFGQGDMLRMRECSTEDMAAAMATIAELKATTAQLEADKVELEVSVRAKDSTLGDIPLHLWLVNLLNHAVLNLSLERVIRIRLVLCADFAMRCLYSLN